MRRTSHLAMSDGRASALFVIGFVALPSLLFLTGARLLGVATPIVDLEVLVAGLLCAAGWRRFGAALASAALFLHTVILLGSVYHFSPIDAVRALAMDFRHLAGWQPTLLLVGALLTIALVTLAYHRLAERCGSAAPAGPLAALLLFAVGIDAAAGSSFMSAFTRQQSRFNVAGSSALRLRALWAIDREMRDQNAALAARGAAPLVRAAAPLAAATSAAPPLHEVLVLVESWGLPRDPAAAEVMLSSLLTPSVTARYEVVTGHVPFAGATTSAELRELCARAGNHLLAAALPAERCLPQTLHRSGYQAVAFHGFTGAMFDRTAWYRHLGFDAQFFRDALSQLPQCGRVFVGACDSAVAHVIGGLLRSARTPQFVHWVTLDGHLPVDQALAARAARRLPCPEALRTAGTDVCQQAAIVRATLRELAALAADPRLPPTRFVVVGDHAPPFLRPASRAPYSPTDVPYVHLVPRSAAAPAPPPAPSLTDHVPAIQAAQGVPARAGAP